MAYRILGSSQTSEVQGGTKIVRVKEYQVESLPSETYFQFRRPVTTDQATVRSVAKQLSDRIEAVHKLPTVTDIVYSQDTTQGGRLQDRMITYYATPDGAISGDVESSLAQFGPNFTKAQIDAEIAAGGDYLGS